MAYDEEMADRVREILAAEPALTEQRMFGGLAFLINQNMALAVSGRGVLLVRVDRAEVADLLGPHVAEAEMGGWRMRGWLDVQPEAFATDDDLAEWVNRGAAYARALPPKPAKQR